MSGLVGRVEQLLEQGRSIAKQADVGPSEQWAMVSGGDVKQFAVAAVNLVEPLARDWQRLKRIEEAARRVDALRDGTVLYEQRMPEVYVALDELRVALAAVSGEPD